MFAHPVIADPRARPGAARDPDKLDLEEAALWEQAPDFNRLHAMLCVRIAPARGGDDRLLAPTNVAAYKK
jgi:hypothetical protein